MSGGQRLKPRWRSIQHTQSFACALVRSALKYAPDSKRVTHVSEISGQFSGRAGQLSWRDYNHFPCRGLCRSAELNWGSAEPRDDPVTECSDCARWVVVGGTLKGSYRPFKFVGSPTPFQFCRCRYCVCAVSLTTNLFGREPDSPLFQQHCGAVTSRGEEGGQEKKK
jgi:hypothetical protein